MTQFAGNAYWVETSPLFTPRLLWTARPSPLNYKNEYLMFAFVEETATQAVVGSIVLSAFRSFKKPRIRKMSARSYGFIACTLISFSTSDG